MPRGGQGSPQAFLQPHHPPVDGRSSILATESSLHTGCTEYTPAFDYSIICLRARTESPNLPAFEALTRTLLSQGGCVPNEHRPDPTPPPHHGQGRGGSKKESFSLRVSPALHPPERPSPRRADMAGHGLGRETRERRLYKMIVFGQNMVKYRYSIPGIKLLTKSHILHAPDL